MRVFLDVDGVLADFTMGAHRKMGIDLDYNNWPYPKGPEGWDWQHCLGMTFEELSEICDFEFWKGLPWTSDGRDILRVILKFVEQGNITLLTTPMPHVMSASGKMAWIEKNLPAYKWHTLISSGKKDILAGVPDSILVDDSQNNVDAWRGVGGKAVLVPRRWNNRWPEVNTASISVELQLEALCRHHV